MDSINDTDKHQRPILIQYDADSVFPLELVQEMNQAYFLHILARNPEEVLPPGKSLISIVTQEKIGRRIGENEIQKADVQEQVAKAIHAAFWDVTAEKLSSPEPSEQNLHIRRLHNDIREAISPLFPPKHELLDFLSLHPAPSTSPLHSFISTLKEVLTSLRKRCAPIRDGEIDAELQKLENPPPQDALRPQDLGQPLDGKTTNVSPLSKFVTQSLRAVLTIADHMKSDLSDFLLGSMTEEQLKALVIREAKFRERDLVIKLWSLHGQNTDKKGEEIIREQWRYWCQETEETTTALPEDHWKLRLIKALSSSVPISCAPPRNINNMKSNYASPNENRLPPQLFFSARSLHRLQNFLQALVITAALRSLTRIPSPSSSTSTTPVQISAQSFTKRIWTLLQTELDGPVEAEKDEGDLLKLVNLADEVVRARRLVMTTLDLSEEQSLREAVERTLRPSDPAFLLLQRRLMDALSEGIISKTPSNKSSQVPDKLKTGYNHPDERTETRPKLVIDDDFTAETHMMPSLNTVRLAHSIKGFEDPVLSKIINEAFVRLMETVRWTESVWGDLV